MAKIDIYKVQYTFDKGVHLSEQYQAIVAITAGAGDSALKTAISGTGGDSRPGANIVIKTRELLIPGVWQ